MVLLGCPLLCLFYALFNSTCISVIHLGGHFPSNLFWKEPVLNFPPRQTTKASLGDGTNTREVTEVEVSESNHGGGPKLFCVNMSSVLSSFKDAQK